MSFWIIIVFVLLVILVYLLWAPVVLFIDTASNKYQLRYGALAKASLESDPVELIRLRISIFFLRFNTYPLRWKKGAKKTDKRKTRRKSRRMSFRQLNKLLRSFRVRQFLLQLDTGDYVLNAKLIPLAVAAQVAGAKVMVNFQNSNRFVLKLENRAFDILKSFY